MRERRILDLTEVTKGPLTRWRSPTAWRTYSEYFCNSHGLNTVRVLAKAPQIEHAVQIQKFHRWLSERGTTPGDMTARAKIREILGVTAS